MPLEIKLPDPLTEEEIAQIEHYIEDRIVLLKMLQTDNDFARARIEAIELAQRLERAESYQNRTPPASPVQDME
jgi:hypothetical protein